MDGWMQEGMNGSMDEWMEIRIDGWMDGGMGKEEWITRGTEYKIIFAVLWLRNGYNDILMCELTSKQEN